MIKLFSSQRFLAFYSGILTVAFAVVVLTGFEQARGKQKFGEIDVERINVVEPDGTLRMVISNKAAFPGIILKGKETPHPNRKTAGMLFFNDEGSENGGLIFGGSKDKDGKVSSYGHLSFDRYEQDQVFTVDADEDGASRSSTLKMVDEPDYSMRELIDASSRISKLPKDQQSFEWPKFFATHAKAKTRLVLGRSDDRSVALRLKDVEGRDRIVVEVGADGKPSLQFLDEAGKVTAQLPAAPQ